MRTAALITITMILAMTALACGQGPQAPKTGAAAAQASQATTAGDTDATTGGVTAGDTVEDNIEAMATQAEATAGAKPRLETITVPGAGIAESLPDFVRLNLGATLKGQDTLDILAHVTKANAAMTERAIQMGIDPADIRTGVFQVHENVVYDPDVHQHVQEGFTANQSTTVTIRDLPNLEKTTTGLIQAIVDSTPADLVLNGLSPGLDEPETLRLEALEKAARDLWDQARTTARASGREICGLLEAQVGGAGNFHGPKSLQFDQPAIRPASGRAASEESYSRKFSGVSISPGKLAESSWATGVFSLVPHDMTRDDAGCGALPQTTR